MSFTDRQTEQWLCKYEQGKKLLKVGKCHIFFFNVSKIHKNVQAYWLEHLTTKI